MRALCALLVLLISYSSLASFKSLRFDSFIRGTIKQRENATFVTLCQNSDLYSILESIQSVEDRFNHVYHYDWVFLNDEPFVPEFKETISSMVSGRAKFGTVDVEHWAMPEWIDLTRVSESLAGMKDRVVYGGSLSYRQMCRFFSGFFQWHELMMEYKYYWRVEPGIRFHCDVNYDVFEEMRKQRRRYGFAISIYEYKQTIPSLFDSVVEFLQINQLEQVLISEGNLARFLIDYGTDGEMSPSLCHFWSNFEVGDLDLFRSELYKEYFEHLDSCGGFFYERWGDAPVHTIFVALFLSREDVVWIDSPGYEHAPYGQCPQSLTQRLESRCACDPSHDFTSHDYSCTPRFLALNGLEKGRLRP